MAMRIVVLAGLAATVAAAPKQEVRIIQQGVAIGAPAGTLAPMPLGNGVVVGQVVDAGTKRAVAGALVTLGLTGVSPLRVMADGDGRFAFRDVPRGSFTITATRPGYADGASGRTRPSGPSRPVELTDGQRMAEVTIPMWRYAVIAGAVVDERGDPVVGTTVRVLKRTIAAGRRRLVAGATDTTDDRGTYRISTLEPGDYVVAVPMTENTMPGGLDLFIADPGRDVMVSAPNVGLNLAAAAGGQIGGGGGAMTFAIEGAGNSTFAGVAEDGTPLNYQTTYYPAASTAARAALVTLGSGEERLGIDVQLRPVRTARISGTLSGPDGPAQNMTLTLVPADADDLVSPLETASASTDGNGAFTFTGVPPGQYTLRVVRAPRPVMAVQPGTTTIMQSGTIMTAMTIRETVNTALGGPPLPADPTLWAELPISVATSDISGVSVVLRPGARVQGSVEFSGAATRPPADRLPAIGVFLDSADGRPIAGGQTQARGRVEPSGQFTTVGVPAGRYFVRVGAAPEGWSFRGAMHGGRDVSDVPLEIEGSDVGGIVLTFTDRPTELSGTVTNTSGSADTDASVIVFPAEREGWINYGSSPRRLKSVRASADGAFRISNLPPGDYFIAAVGDEASADWQEPAFLEALSREATRVRLGEGSRITQSLRTVAPPRSGGLTAARSVARPKLVAPTGNTNAPDERIDVSRADGAEPAESAPDEVTGHGRPEAPQQRDPVRQPPTRDLAPKPAGGTAVLSGRILTDDVSAVPVRQVRVTAVATGPESLRSQSAVTDDVGRFTMQGLPAGRYTLSATKPGFVRAAFGAKRPDRPGTPITLADGQQMTDITLRMSRGAVITGVITDEQGAPAANATVRLMQYRVVNGERTLGPVMVGGLPSEQTDDRGVYRLFGLAPGEYVVSATPRISTAGDVRAMTPDEIQAALRAAADATRVTPGGSQQAPLAGASGGVTGAPAVRELGVTVGFTPVYYPGTTISSNAALVSVGAGEERSGVDFQLQLVRTARIEGTVMIPPGVRPAGVQLIMVPTNAAGSALGALGGLMTLNRTTPAPDGKFSYSGVVPGQYTITARTGGVTRLVAGGGADVDVMQVVGSRMGGPGPVGGDTSGPPQLWGLAEVVVEGQNISNLVITLQPGMTLSGRVVFEGGRPSPEDHARVRVMLGPAPAATAGVTLGVPAGQVDASGAFRLTGIAPGKYRLSAAAGTGGWTLKSAVAKGADALDYPLEIGPNEEVSDAVLTFTDRTQEVAGTLQDPTGRPAPDFTIVVFAADSRYWTPQSRRIRTTRPGTDGKFTISNLPAGDYRIAALVDIAPGEANDPALLEQLVAASYRFTLAEGEKKVQDLRITGGGGV
jgi:hypothetical protein